MALVSSSTAASVTSFASRYQPAKDANGVQPAPAKALEKKVSKLEDDTRNQRCDDIIQNDKTAVQQAAAVPNATASAARSAKPTSANHLDVYA